MILRGIDVGFVDLGVPAGLSERAAALYPQTLTACLGELSGPTSFGALAPADLIRPEVDITDVVAALNADYRKRGVKVTYKTYEGVGHGRAVKNSKSARDATSYIRSRLHR